MEASTDAFIRPASVIRALGQAGDARDFNELTRLFQREISARSRDGCVPKCLFVDVEESGQAIWAASALGEQSRDIRRSAFTCFGEPDCHQFSQRLNSDGSFKLGLSGGPDCRVIVPLAADARSAEAGAKPADADLSSGEFDLVISCHSLSFLSHPRALCFLSRLRQSVRTGGMLFISALGKFSVLADSYPSEEHPLSSRFFPLRNGPGHTLGTGTRVCLYSERELCTTLFNAGWSVLRSSTSTENNVLATAVRI